MSILTDALRVARSVSVFVFALAVVLANFALAQDDKKLPVPDSEAATEGEMKPYIELLEHTQAKIEMVPIKGGEFLMGSPDKEEGRKDDEGPQHKVKVSPFWMGKFETTWDAYEVWMFDLDIQRRELKGEAKNARDVLSEEYQISQPTSPYTDMTFGMGKKGFPAICMTQFAARTYCEWLSRKTGRYYRLPTEAEWEYACRAGTTTRWSFGDEADKLDDHAWHFDNAGEKYHKVGTRKPNPWGLFDMHGNVAEWTLDEYSTDFYKKSAVEIVTNPLLAPKTEYPQVARGGSWDADPIETRSAARDKSTPDWKKQDPQIPKSIWYHTDATFVGFRIVRPLTEPSAEERKAKWDNFEPRPDRKQGR
jgi:formylglycine-generating enzyme required for sulfatase activity